MSFFTYFAIKATTSTTTTTKTTTPTYLETPLAEEQEGACPVEEDGTTRNEELPLDFDADAETGAGAAGGAGDPGVFFRRVTITVYL